MLVCVCMLPSAMHNFAVQTSHLVGPISVEEFACVCAETLLVQLSLKRVAVPLQYPPNAFFFF